jgi:hypothetical protein
MDADDIMLPNRLQVQYDFMEEHTDIDICGSWMEVFGNENGTIQLYTDHKQIITSLLLYNSMAHPTVILRISTVCKKGEPLYKHEYNCAEDYKLWIDLAIVGCKFANVSDVLLKYRRSDNHTTKNRYKELQINTLKIQTEYVEAVMQKITDKKEKLLPFFDSLIEISNEDVIEFSRLLEIVHMFYEDYLRI